MRVLQTGAETPSRNRRPQQCMEGSFRTDRHEKEYRGDAGFSGGAKMREGGGSYSLMRHNSVVFEHDYDTNHRSLVHSVSEVREEMQVGLNQGSKDHEKDSYSCKDGYVSDGRQGSRRGKAGTPGSLVRQVSHESHEFSQETYSSSPSGVGGKKGQINSFVFKNYALLDRRTLSLPVGKKYSISEYVGQQTEVQAHLDSDSSSRNVTYSEQRRTSVSSSSCDGNEGYHNIRDFDMEAERYSKSTLFFQAGEWELSLFNCYLYFMC